MLLQARAPRPRAAAPRPPPGFARRSRRDTLSGRFNGLGGFDGLVFGSVGQLEANKAWSGFQDSSLQLKVTAPGSDRLSAFAGASYYEHDILGRNMRLSRSRPHGEAGGSRHIENVSVFGSLTYSLTDRLAVGLDVRWQKDDVRESTATFYPQTPAENPH